MPAANDAHFLQGQIGRTELRVAQIRFAALRRLAAAEHVRHGGGTKQLTHTSHCASGYAWLVLPLRLVQISLLWHGLSFVPTVQLGTIFNPPEL
jgi:hypothetical protein